MEIGELGCDWIISAVVSLRIPTTLHSEEYMCVSPSKARQGAIYCASLVDKHVRGNDQVNPPQELMKIARGQMQPDRSLTLVCLRCMLHPHISP